MKVIYDEYNGVQFTNRHFVGVINKNAKTVKLLNCEWFTLKPSVASK